MLPTQVPIYILEILIGQVFTVYGKDMNKEKVAGIGPF